MGSLAGLDKPVVCLDMPEAVRRPMLAAYHGILLAEPGFVLHHIAFIRLRPIRPFRIDALDERQMLHAACRWKMEDADGGSFVFLILKAD